MKTNIHFWTYLAHFFLEWGMFQPMFWRKSKQTLHILFLFSKKSFLLWNNAEKYCKVGQATDENTTHAQCMLDTYSYKYTLRICNNYCFSTATMVARMRADVKLMRTLRVHFLSYYISEQHLFTLWLLYRAFCMNLLIITNKCTILRLKLHK